MAAATMRSSFRENFRELEWSRNPNDGKRVSLPSIRHSGSGCVFQITLTFEFFGALAEVVKLSIFGIVIDFLTAVTGGFFFSRFRIGFRSTPIPKML
jgi:ABC-type maltose transport system permease subunit